MLDGGKFKMSTDNDGNGSDGSDMDTYVNELWDQAAEADELPGEKTMVMSMQHIAEDESSEAVGAISTDDKPEPELFKESSVQVDQEALKEPEVVSMTPEELEKPGFWAGLYARLNQPVFNGKEESDPEIPIEVEEPVEKPIIPASKPEPVLLEEKVEETDALATTLEFERKEPGFLGRLYQAAKIFFSGEEELQVEPKELLAENPAYEEMELIDRLSYDLTNEFFPFPGSMERPAVFDDLDEAKMALLDFVSAEGYRKLEDILPKSDREDQKLMFLNCAYNLLENDYVRLVKTKADSEKARLILESKIVALRGDLSQAKEDIDSLREVGEDYNRDNENFKQYNDELEGKLDEAEAEASQLKINLESVNKQLGETQGLLYRITGERDSLQKKLRRYIDIMGDHTAEEFRDRTLEAEGEHQVEKLQRQNLEGEFEDYKLAAEQREADLQARLDGVEGLQLGIERSKKETEEQLVAVQAESSSAQERISKLQASLTRVNDTLAEYRVNLGGDEPVEIKAYIESLENAKEEAEEKLTTATESLKLLKDRLGRYHTLTAEQIDTEFDGIKETNERLEESVFDSKEELAEIVEELKGVKQTLDERTAELERVQKEFKTYKLVDPEAQEHADNLFALEEQNELLSAQNAELVVDSHPRRGNNVLMVAAGFLTATCLGAAVYLGIQNADLSSELVNARNQNTSLTQTYQKEKTQMVSGYAQKSKAAEQKHSQFAARANKLNASLQKKLEESKSEYQDLAVESVAMENYASILKADNLGEFQKVLRDYTRSEGGVKMTCSTRAECAEDLYGQMVDGYTPAEGDLKTKEKFVKLFEETYAKTLPEKFGKKISIGM